MDTSIFMEKTVIPTDSELARSLQGTYDLWHEISSYVHLNYPKAIDEWNYSGEKYGWNFRIKDTKRAIVYLLPREGFFKVSMVFGQKATDAIIKSQVMEQLKRELMAARVYAEGRGIRMEIRNEDSMKELKELIDIKIAN